MIYRWSYNKIFEHKFSKYHTGLFVMMKHMNKENKPDLLMIGFALLLPGIFFATILDGGRIIQIIGLILIIASSAVFGVSIRTQLNRKK